MKKITKKLIAVSLAILTMLSTVTTAMGVETDEIVSETLSSDFSISRVGSLNYCGATLGDFEVTGVSDGNDNSSSTRQAFCIENQKADPSDYTLEDFKEISDVRLARILYYGYYAKESNSPSSVYAKVKKLYGSEVKNENVRKIITSSALSQVYAGNSYCNAGNAYTLKQRLLAIANDGSYVIPNNSISLTNSNLTVGKKNNIQVTSSTQLKCFEDNSITFTVPNGVTLVNETTNKKVTGGNKAKISANEKFHFEAPLTYSGTINISNVKGNYAYKFSTYVAKSTNSSTQTVGTYCWAKDTTSSINISATFKASTGDLTIIKTSANTELTVNNPCYSLYGAEFKLVSKTDSSKSYTIKTTTKVAGTENYKGTIKNIPIGKYILKEVSVPSKSGYSIPNEWKTGKEITISVGDNSVSCSNEPTNDPVAIMVKKTDKNGKPLAGAEFTIKFYKGYFSEEEIKSGRADSAFKRYWTLKTDEYGYAGLSSEYLVDSNNDFYYNGDDPNPCLPLGTVTIQEVTAPDGYIKDDTLYVRQITSTGSSEGVFTFNPPTIPNYEKQGYLQIKKTSEDGIVANIDMEIYEGDKVSADKLVGVYTTDSNGLINEKFNIGKYTIKEIVNEDRYHEQEPQTITVTENNTEGNPAKVSFHNTLKDGWLRLVKTSEAINGTRVVAGVKFTIYKGTDENGTLIGTYVTEASTDRNGNPVGLIYEGKYTDGEGNINLSAGTYTIVETKVPQYKKAQSQTITILPNRETSVSFHNVSEEKDYTLTIKKKSAQRGYINEVIEPFKFVVKGNSNDFYREVYLYPHQETVIDIPSVGSYQVYEELTDNQKLYWAEPEQGSQTVLFNNAKNEHKEVTFTNVELTGNLELTKTATDGHIKGAKFVLYGYSYSGRFIVATASTDENGKLSLTGIPYGEYSFYEANAGVGANGETNYYPSLYKHNGKVVINGKSNGTVNITVNNKTGRKVRLVKTSDDGLIEGFEFKVTNVTTGKVIYESIKTNENGEFITSDLAEGRYKFEEILSKDSPYKKQEPQYVDVTFPTTQEEYETPYEVFFANTYEKAEVTLKKTSEDGVVKGVQFDVTGVNYRSEEINKTLTTNADGTFTVKLDEGTYTFKEIYVPYMLNGVEVNGLDYIYNKPEPQTITVKAKETVEIKFNNTLATGTGNLTKVTYDNMFEGIEFTLSGISDAGKKVNISKTIEPSAEYDELGRRLGKLEFINIPVGTYDLKETKAPAKYLTPEVIKVTIKKDETTYVEVENPAKPQTVKIKKTSENGVVEGVVLDIDCDELGYHKTITLNSTGEMLLELVPATYTVTEMYVPFMLNGVEVNGLEYIYEPQEAKTIVVEPYEGQDRNYTVQFNNTLRKGDLTIQKIADDNEVMGVKFNVTGTSMSGEEIDITGVTDTLSEDGKSAKVIIKDIPIGIYTIKEIDAPDRYITTEQQELTIEWNIDKTIAFNNRLRGVISTTAKDKDTGINFAYANSETTIIDTVAYELGTNTTYKVVGTLMDKSTGDVLLIDGKPVTVEKEFNTGDSNTGTVDVEFILNSSALVGKSVVVFEKVFYKDILVTTHEDINDEGQTVTFADPAIGTTLTDTIIDGHDSFVREETTLIDKVEYTNLLAGYEYTVKGLLVDKSTGKAIYSDGKMVESQTTFTANDTNGTVDVEFNFNSLDLKGKSVVCYEVLLFGSNVIAEHKDINDKKQTITFKNPTIGTTAIATDTLTHVTYANELTTVIDTVQFTNLIVGKEYTIDGILMDNSTNEPIIINGETVTATKTFIAEVSNGTVNIEFTFDSTLLKGHSIVVFETLSYNNLQIATHQDINDKLQTITVAEPSLGTQAKDKLTELNNTYTSKNTTISDTVKYQGLVLGKSYTIKGYLVDKDTVSPIIVGDTPLYAETTFVAESTNGTVDVEFTFDSTELIGKSIVCFEYLYFDNNLIAEHTDINDNGQTITFAQPKIKTTAKDKSTNTNQAYTSTKTTIVDTVKYTGLIIGKKYTVTGVLMSKETGKALLVGGKQVTATKTFKATTENGSVDVEFTFDSSALEGKSVVVFETLYFNDLEIATHADINDKGQTVTFEKPDEIESSGTPDQIDSTGKPDTTESTPYKSTPYTGSSVPYVLIILFISSAGIIFLSRKKANN